MEVWVRLGPMMARQSLSLVISLVGVEPGLGDVAFVVINDQLHGMPIDAALGVDIFDHHLQGIPFRLPQIGGRAADGEDAAHRVGHGFSLVPAQPEKMSPGLPGPGYRSRELP